MTFQPKLNPARIGLSRIYVTFVSDNVCSITRTIPLEVIAEPLDETDEPLLEHNAEMLAKADEESKKAEEKSISSQSDISESEDKQSVDQEQIKPITSSSTMEENQDKQMSNITQVRSDAPITQNGNESTEELGLKTKQTDLPSNAGIASPSPLGSTSSLDNDKISLDSFELPNDRRYIPNTTDDNQ